MTKPRVLISDSMSSQAVAIFEERGVEVVQSSKLSEAELFDMIGDFDALAIRSSTKVTQELLGHSERLKVVGRAGIGVDNVDVPACTRRGIVVMNTPLGNAITTAEHAHGHDAGTGASHSAGQQFDACRQVGKVALHGCRANRQAARSDRRRQHRLHRRAPRQSAMVSRCRLTIPFSPTIAPRKLGVKPRSTWIRAAGGPPISSRCTCRRRLKPQTSSAPAHSTR